MLVKMSKQYHRSLLVFYLSSPPRRGDRGNDFRVLPEEYSAEENAFLDVLIRDVRARQSMVRAILEDEDEGERLAFVGSMAMSSGVDAVVHSIRNVTSVSIDEFRAQESAEAAFGWLREKIESVGIYVLLMSNLGSHHTTITADIFRGIALADEVAPFVVINDQDSKAAWSFTLLHEVAHLWLGQTGVSGGAVEAEIELFCNEVASQCLLPNEDLAQLRVADDTEFQLGLSRISDFARARNVSSSMVAYRLYKAGRIRLITWAKYRDSFREQWINWRLQNRGRAKGRAGGPDYFVVRRYHVGTALINLVRRMVSGGALTTTKAGTVLGVRPKNVQTLIDLGGQADARRLA